MKKTSSAVTRVSTDMFIHQGSWALGFLFIVLLIYIGVGIGTSIGVNVRAGIAEEDYFSITYRSTKGFMLVIGIISAYGFLSYYVRNGITRRDFFKGAALAAVYLSLAFPVVVGLVHWIIGMVTSHDASSTLMQKFDNNWLLILVSYGVQIFIYYLMGWMIGSGFYRFDWIRGLGWIALALVLIAFMDALWQFELASIWEQWLPVTTDFSVTLPVSLAGSLIVILIALILIRLITRRVTIKM
ncbi:Tat pathway signal protein [Paenibacillus sp. p3-SID867]|uniref:Tat pathway signal protein n=1 Tax=Paenibacillus sp. p3-SID867 TaxID=2916363 RepID=UPI0021A66A0C|nr:Tat pathway signal protein [Paenibacillus sp. p3-SID867]MCT1400141.1 Tat pathway signal protein [Paenibacillus sp. p3-SID867]